MKKPPKVDSGITSGGAINRREHWYDTAQICTNGHIINSNARSEPEKNKDFCERIFVISVEQKPL